MARLIQLALQFGFEGIRSFDRLPQLGQAVRALLQFGRLEEGLAVLVVGERAQRLR